jgi:hypothetical protein
VATIQPLTNGTVCTQLPSCKHWIRAYNNDVELCTVHELAPNLALITSKQLLEVNHNFCGPLCLSQISVEDEMLIMNKPIFSGVSYTHQQLAPKELYNIFFVDLRTNAISGHLNPYWMLHRLQLYFYWPGMYGYIKHMCQACLGYALSNPNCGKPSELVYNFSMKSPFLVMHFDAYATGKYTRF